MKKIILAVLVLATFISCSISDDGLGDNCECVQYIKSPDGSLTKWGTTQGKCTSESIGIHVFKEKCN